MCSRQGNQVRVRAVAAAAAAVCRRMKADAGNLAGAAAQCVGFWGVVALLLCGQSLGCVIALCIAACRELVHGHRRLHLRTLWCSCLHAGVPVPKRHLL